MSDLQTSARGRLWFDRLTGGRGQIASGLLSILAADANLGGEIARFIAVVPDPAARFKRARRGEVGLEEGWTLARLVQDTLQADGVARRPIVAIVDVPSQAYGRNEEMLGIHLACAAAVDAYAQARLAGHPVVALLVGHAMSGAFLAHGYQANRLLALDDPGVIVHAMSKPAAARVTRRSVGALEALANRCPPMAYDVRSFARLGLLHTLIPNIDADRPSREDTERVHTELAAAVSDIRLRGDRGLGIRLQTQEASVLRAASREVRWRLSEQWS